MQSYCFQSKTRHFHLMQFWNLQKNLYLKSMVYNFSRMVLNFFQGLTYQNYPFYTDYLVLLHSFFAIICCVSSFVRFVFELRSFHNSFTKCVIYMRFLIASKCINFLWRMFIRCVYKFFLEI